MTRPTLTDFDLDTGQRVDVDDPCRPARWSGLLWGLGAVLTHLACQAITLGRWIWPGRKP